MTCVAVGRVESRLEHILIMMLMRSIGSDTNLNTNVHEYAMLLNLNGRVTLDILSSETVDSSTCSISLSLCFLFPSGQLQVLSGQSEPRVPPLKQWWALSGRYSIMGFANMQSLYQGALLSGGFKVRVYEIVARPLLNPQYCR